MRAFLASRDCASRPWLTAAKDGEGFRIDADLLEVVNLGRAPVGNESDVVESCWTGSASASLLAEGLISGS